MSMVAQVKAQYGGWNSPYQIFPPGTPLEPISQEPVRLLDFQVGSNTIVTPRSYEPFGFPQLRAFANVELVRLAIETRKDQLERLDWQIKPLEARSSKKTDDARIKALMKFWRKPDGVNPFSTWLRLVMEDLLVLDAPAIERRRLMGGELIGLDIVPGDTIHPMVDPTGRRPTGATDVAYQQVIKGVPWANLTNADLIYAPRNPRPNKQYGFGPVEQIIVTINTILRRQALQLAYFTAGNTPAGLLVGPEGWTPAQVKQMQEWLDSAVSGDQASQSKLLWVPGGTKYQAFKEAPLKDDFDEWLARIVAYAFSLPPTPFIKQMNRSTAGADQDRGLEEGLEPIKLWVKRLIDGVLQDDLGCDDLEFAWNDTPEIDPDKQSQIDDRNLKNGTATIDEVRDARGDDPLPDGLGAQAMIYTSTGAMTLEQVLKAAEDAVNPIEPPRPDPDNTPPAPGQEEPGGTVQPPTGEPQNTAPPAAPTAATKLAKASRKIALPVDRPKVRRARAAFKRATAGMLASVGDDVAAQVAMRLRGLHKAADDGSAMAAQISAALDLSGFDGLPGLIVDDLIAVRVDASLGALIGTGAKPDDGITDQVSTRAVAAARARAAEMVGKSYDDAGALIDNPNAEFAITDATRDMLRELIAKGLEDNIGSSAIADQIQESYAFSADRAEMIARTEIGDANSQAALDGFRQAKDLGVKVKKTWDTAGDDDVEEECEENEAAGAIDLDDLFPSGDSEPLAHVGCRCALGGEVDDSSDDTEPGDADDDQDAD